MAQHNLNQAILYLEGEVANAVGWDDIKAIIDPITTQFSVANIAAIIAGVLGVSVGFVFMWWGVRKLYGIVLKAAKRGKGGV